MAASVNNYSIFKGIVSFKADGTSTYLDMGNAPEVEFTPELEELEHLSSREGVASVDKKVVSQKSATLRIVFDEATIDVLKLALMGEENSDGGVDIFSVNSIAGAIKIVGTNEVGNKYETIFPSVSFIPTSGINFISEEWATFEVTGTVQVSGGIFGTMNPIA